MRDVYVGGRVFTADPAEPWAAALAVEDGAIVAVGSAADCGAGDPDVAVVDTTGCVVLPGFVDGHVHLISTGGALTKAQLRTAGDLAAIRQRLVAWADANPDAPSVLGTGFLSDAVPGNEPTRHMLDDLFPDRPVFLESFDLHCGWVNSAALAAMGVTRDTPDPIGGEIRRDADGEPTGYLLETALSNHMWRFLADIDDETRDRHLAAAIAALNASGTTTAVDMALDAAAAAAIERAEQAGTLTVRVLAHWFVRNTGNPSDDLAQVAEAARRAELHRSDRFRVVGIKLVVDGTIDACTAAMIDLYTTGGNDDPIWPSEALDPVVAAADAAGLQVACHAIGDRAIRIAIDAIERAQRANGTTGRRHRIEHLEYADAADIPRLGALGITASMQPVHCDPEIADNWIAMLGDERAGEGFNWPAFVAGGATLAFGTDTPTAPYQPLPNMYIAATRRSPERPDLEPLRPDFALPIDESIVHGTRDAAYASFEEHRLGVLRPGAAADLVMIDADPFADGPDVLLAARVRRTVVAGRTVHQA